MRPLFDAGLRVSELVTDENSMIVADFKKVNAALQEIVSNEKNSKRPEKTTKRQEFASRISSVLVPCKPQDVPVLLNFYGVIFHGLDCWHKAKNVLLAVKRVRTVNDNRMHAGPWSKIVDLTSS